MSYALLCFFTKLIVSSNIVDFSWYNATVSLQGALECSTIPCLFKYYYDTRTITLLVSSRVSTYEIMFKFSFSTSRNDLVISGGLPVQIPLSLTLAFIPLFS